ncbi:hypothetical protein CH306_15720 [Rhodococcus sp. 15-725-2-2b]|uniref:DUF3558 domain-containing protein n=1 Tax=unclassified Rhodococcus (in: high G+C Gram-positive bacteria) TaxID=192944 RepID=UPI000B9A4C5E|nr:MULTISPECIES: DUF3558 domain-containing protein [unclassified Rhodococcus (in: high G+C Gram-positive bacteria)]OZC65953.1 hypothetical protein CH277_16630 [Rhodococcus sp. 06-469-3-2]OZD41770.1 hypothetical protein CH264_22690 [Rhodococcus sp. 06-1477-1A]OZE04219.1 hypothetical protein CH249_26310 [Rhodococcus sp. 05-2255-3B1]OZE16617.1 hypothetical protein CH250_01180 [Rhodococcus sp. 05-2255-3C]OZE22420.1 hypothetical protein CH255_05720 [Rhodococcus sp. 05-2255-2A2]
MGTRAVAASIAAIACGLVGCSNTPGTEADPNSPETAEQPVTEELFVGECGSMDNTEVQRLTAVSDLTVVSENAVRCRWESATGAYAMFTWYRGSPIDRERSVAEAVGRTIERIDVDGHPGFTAAASGASCEAGVENGDGFVHWSVNYVIDGPRDSCDVVEDLARTTMSKAK